MPIGKLKPATGVTLWTDPDTGEQVQLKPGDRVELTEHQVVTVGDKFEIEGPEDEDARRRLRFGRTKPSGHPEAPVQPGEPVKALIEEPGRGEDASGGEGEPRRGPGRPRTGGSKKDDTPPDPDPVP